MALICVEQLILALQDTFGHLSRLRWRQDVQHHYNSVGQETVLWLLVGWCES